MNGAAHVEIDLDLDLDGALPHQQLRLAGIRRSRRMGLEALFLQACNGLADGVVDALERERVVDEHERRDTRQQSGAVQIDLVHGFSTRRPSAERDTHGRSLPLGNWDGSSLLAQGWESSRPSCRHRRTVLTLVQRLSRSLSASARKLELLSTSSRASCSDCRTPTSL